MIKNENYTRKTGVLFVTLLSFYVRPICCWADIKSVVDFTPSALNHFWSYSGEGSSDALAQMQQITNRLSVHHVLYVPPQKEIKKSKVWANHWEIWYSRRHVQLENGERELHLA